MGTKNSTTGRPEKYVQIFYTGADATQYFVKPLSYTSGSGLEISLDFTFRDSVERPPVRMLFSVLSEESLSGHASCSFGLDKDHMKAADKVFAEPVKSGFKYRYEILISYEDFVQMIRKESPFTIQLGELIAEFSPDRKALKAFPHIDRSTITMLETR